MSTAALNLKIERVSIDLAALRRLLVAAGSASGALQACELDLRGRGMVRSAEGAGTAAKEASAAADAALATVRPA